MSLYYIEDVVIFSRQNRVKDRLKGSFSLGADLIVPVTRSDDTIDGGDEDTEMLYHLRTGIILAAWPDPFRLLEELYGKDASWWQAK